MIDPTRKVRRTDDHSVTGDVFDSGRECDCPLIVVHDELAKQPTGGTHPRHEHITRDGRNMKPFTSIWENVPEVRTVDVWVVTYKDGGVLYYDHDPQNLKKDLRDKIFGTKHVSVPIEKGEGL